MWLDVYGRICTAASYPLPLQMSSMTSGSSPIENENPFKVRFNAFLKKAKPKNWISCNGEVEVPLAQHILHL